MNTEIFTLNDINTPQILAEKPGYLIVYKPPKMHSAPGSGYSLADWCSALFPETSGIYRGKERGGLIYRLDFETQGLLLIARNQMTFDKMLEQQGRGEIGKIYSAIVSKSQKKPAGFPPFCAEFFPDSEFPQIIESSFRPFGPGRREVRPLAENRGKIYRTEIQEKQKTEENLFLKIKIMKGFRHQIRCHLAWAGYPVLNDPVYGTEKTGEGILALRAQEINFTDPVSGEMICCSLPTLGPSDI